MQTTLRPLDALFPRTRQAVLGAMLVRGGKWWYLSDLARHLGSTPSSLQRELARLAASGILLTRKDGNRVYFKADTDNPIYPDLRRLMEKTSGVAEVIRQTVFGGTSRRPAVAFVFGSVARGEDDASSDIDLLVVGRTTMFAITPKLRRAEAVLGRPINAIVFPPEEFARKVGADNHFLKNVVSGEKLFVVGGEDDLAAAVHGGRPSAPRGDQEGDRRSPRRRGA